MRLYLFERVSRESNRYALPVGLTKYSTCLVPPNAEVYALSFAQKRWLTDVEALLKQLKGSVGFLLGSEFCLFLKMNLVKKLFPNIHPEIPAQTKSTRRSE